MAASTPSKTPVTMLSGFLGSGKTTLLRYLLENSKEKIACIVNDVASINIDAKLVRNDRNRARADGVNTTADLADTIELANGCACCNLQDELFASFEQVLALADRRGEPYARIVLENSGVAEPQNIRDKFGEAAAAGHPLLERIELDALVTLVDSATFIKDYASRVAMANRPELGEGGSLRPVVDLLVEQVECADYVVLNKADQLPQGSDAMQQLMAIVASLNPLATVIPATQCRVDLELVFGPNARHVAKLNVEGQHRGAVAAARMLAQQQQQQQQQQGHVHSEACGEACTHDHSHGHSHGHTHEHHHHGEGHSAEDCAVCSDGDHAHAHSDKHSHEHAHSDDHSHSHDHSDDHNHSHEHGHAHEHGVKKAHAETRAAERFGIRSFVYERRRPFHPQRLRNMVLRWLPVTSNNALEGEAPTTADSPIRAVLRSKGFMWMSSSHTTAYYWSHAGQHFEIRDEGDWWVAVPDDEWPGEGGQRDLMLSDFGERWGDRRQEIVFIGAGMDQAKIGEQLDSALLTDEEMVRYEAKWGTLEDPKHPAAPATAQSQQLQQQQQQQ